MDTGSTEISRVASLLAGSESSAFARALLRASEAGWEVSHAWVAVTPDSPPGWIEQTWRYNHLVFVASAVPVKELANLCSPGGGTILLGGIEATVPAPQHLSQWTRRPSFGRHDPVVLPWPTVEFIVHRAIQNQEQIPSETLTGESAPSFPEPQSAWRAFFAGNFSLTGAHGLPNELGLIRMADTKGWLDEVHVTPTQLTVQVHGNELAGVRLELFGATDRAEQSVTGQGTAVFPLQRGLPPDAWLWLKRGTEWLDYRSIDARSNWSSDLKRAGVTIEIPSDPQANVQALLAAGEGPQVEFKRELPETAEQKRKHFKTVAAFANGDGGDLVFGMDPDELTVVGLGKEDPKTLRDHLYALIHRTVVPSPSVLIEDHQVNDKTILVLHVEPGAAPPYGLAVDKSTRDKPDYFIRRGSSTYPAQPGELREAARSRPPMHTTVR